MRGIVWGNGKVIFAYVDFLMYAVHPSGDVYWAFNVSVIVIHIIQVLISELSLIPPLTLIPIIKSYNEKYSTTDKI